jgi:hypothetical protein
MSMRRQCCFHWNDTIWKNTFFTTRWTGLPRVELSPPRSLTARWMGWNDSREKNSQQENASSPLEVRNRVQSRSLRG